MARILGKPVIMKIGESLEESNSIIEFGSLNDYILTRYLDIDEVYAEKLYAWERNITYGQELSFMEAVDLVEDICSDYFIDPPAVVFYPNDKEGNDPCYDFNDHIIWIPKFACFTSIVIHECAHAIFDTYGSVLAHPHGPEFVALLCELYNQYLYESGMITIDGYMLSEAYLRRSAITDGELEVADSWFSVGSAAYYLGVNEDAIEMLRD